MQRNGLQDANMEEVLAHLPGTAAHTSCPWRNKHCIRIYVSVQVRETKNQLLRRIVWQKAYRARLDTVPFRSRGLDLQATTLLTFV